jgi:uncharacterized protein (DUF1684 family)
MLGIASVFFSLIGYGQDREAIVRNILDHRKEQHDEFADREKSPLEKRDRKRFIELKYYPIDLKFHVKAKLVVNGNPVLFQMPTTTTRLPEYSKYGDLYFTIDDKEYKLEVYQNPEISKRAGYEDYLFIPFTDETNGEETYEVGRYLEFRIPTSNDVYIDFNLCYNPYCSYSNRFSCPIPPSQNHLPIRITAGEKKYFEDH